MVFYDEVLLILKLKVHKHKLEWIGKEKEMCVYKFILVMVSYLLILNRQLNV